MMFPLPYATHWNVYWGVAAFTAGISRIESTDTTHKEMKNDWYLIIIPLFCGSYPG